MVNKNITILSQSYPFGVAEVFLENELKVLALEFKSITVINADSRSLTQRSIPENVHSVSLGRVAGKKEKLGAYLSPLCLKSIFSLSSPERKFWLGYYAEALNRKKFLEKKGLNKTEIYYSYWGDEWSLALALLKSEGKIKSFYFRVHGYDLFEERTSGGKIPFRSFVIKQATRIFPVSEAGKIYLDNKYPEYNAKFVKASLGVFDRGITSVNEDAIPIVVSCSNLIPLKRVHLIAEILGNLNRKIKWVHFGDGVEREKIMQTVGAFPLVELKLMGHVKNEIIMSFYQENAVDAFLHMSESEGGVPVSIQEAISFGIPVLAADAGGVKEIVSERTGILLNHAVDVPIATEQLQSLLNTYSRNKEKRLAVREVWKESYNAEVVFHQFAKQLTNE